MNSGKLRIEPNLPKQWSQLDFVILWQGVKLKIHVTKNGFDVLILDSEDTVTFHHKGQAYVCTGKTSIEFVQ